jgi:hypothetical protein
MKEPIKEPISPERVEWMAATAELRAKEGSASIWDRDVARALRLLSELLDESDPG